MILWIGGIAHAYTRVCTYLRNREGLAWTRVKRTQSKDTQIEKNGIQCYMRQRDIQDNVRIYLYLLITSLTLLCVQRANSKHYR
jgi:hypothetical protein